MCPSFFSSFAARFDMLQLLVLRGPDLVLVISNTMLIAVQALQSLRSLAASADCRAEALSRQDCSRTQVTEHKSRGHLPGPAPAVAAALCGFHGQQVTSTLFLPQSAERSLLHVSKACETSQQSEVATLTEHRRSALSLPILKAIRLHNHAFLNRPVLLVKTVLLML